MKKRNVIACICMAFVVCSSSFVAGAAYLSDKKAAGSAESAVSREEFKPVTEQEKVIYNYVSDTEKYASLAVNRQYFCPEAIESMAVYDIGKADPIYLSQQYDYSGKIYDKASYYVEYDVQYKHEYCNEEFCRMSECSGVYKKYVTLILTDEGWLINEIGY